MPAAPSRPPSRANTRYSCETLAPVIQRFSPPLRTNPSAVGGGLGLQRGRRDPASGSVMAMAGLSPAGDPGQEALALLRVP